MSQSPKGSKAKKVDPYPDKQKHLISIFNRLKEMLKLYENPMRPKFDLDSKYDLWSFKEVEIAGRTRKEVYFAGLIIQSSYVGFYYMPVYTDTKLKDIFEPELLSLLKGKSCFHIKKLDSNLERQIIRALKLGYELYKKRGWV
jgi:hypothetical protein